MSTAADTSPSALDLPTAHLSRKLSGTPRTSICKPPQRSNRQPHNRTHRAQGIGCSPQRNQGGGRRLGDIRGGEYPVTCARAPDNSAPNKGREEAVNQPPQL